MMTQAIPLSIRTRTIRRKPNRLGEYTLAVNVVGRLPSGSLWGQAFSKIAPVLGPVGWAVSAGFAAYSLVRLFQSWSQRGELKIAATAKAEDFVESIWGTLQPNSPPQTDSVSKLIDECRLNEAQSMITFLARQMYEKGNQDPYLKKWVDEWGMETLRLIERKLDAYLGYCSNDNEAVQPSPTCPPNFELVSGVCKPLSCPPGFYLSGSICVPLSPPTMPPSVDESGQYVPLSSSSGSWGMLGLLAALAAAVIITR